MFVYYTAYAGSVLKRCNVRPSVRMSQGQRAWQQQSRTAAGDAHRRPHMPRGPRKFWSDCLLFVVTRNAYFAPVVWTIRLSDCTSAYLHIMGVHYVRNDEGTKERL